VAAAMMLVGLGMTMPLPLSSQSSVQTKPSATQDTLMEMRMEMRPSFLRYGLFGHYNFYRHTIGFREFVPSCCPQNFPNTANTGLTVGGLIELPIVGGLGIVARVAYSPLLTTFRTTGTVRSRIGVDVPRSLPITYSLETALGSVDGELMLGLRPFGGGELRNSFLAGLSLYAGGRGTYFLQRRFRQFEQLDDPSVVYETGTNIRGLAEGEIPNVRAFTPFLLGGLSIEIPLNSQKTILLAPEAFYVHPLMSILQDRLWQASSVRAGVSLRFGAPATLSPVDASAASKEAPAATPSTPKPSKKEERLPPNMLGAKIFSVSAMRTSATGAVQQVNNPLVELTESVLTRSRPLLNAVFFDEKSSEIPERYMRLKSPNERARFQIDPLAQADPLTAYYNILNIVGRRMNAYPKAKLTLIGYADAQQEQGGSQAGAALAQKRAERIRAYLKEMWKVDERRIAIKVGAPFPPSSPAAAARDAEEQRRVELSADVPELLDELRSTEIIRAVKPPVLNIRFDISAPAGLKEWKLEAVQTSEQARILKVFKGGSTFPESVDWNIASAPQDSMPRTNDDIVLRLEATDITGKSVKSPLAFVSVDMPGVNLDDEDVRADKPTEKKPNGERIDVVSVYGNNTATAFTGTDEIALRLVAKAKALIRPNSSVNITGFSDSNSPDVRQSSEARAQAVKNLLDEPRATAQGKGISTAFDNALPEGRWYNRVVEIEMRTPSQK
jgi:outer membrane protein OmpA-like peptidoglycan-associated protein